MPTRVTEKRKHRKVPVGDMRMRAYLYETQSVARSGGKVEKKFVYLADLWGKFETDGRGTRQFNKRHTQNESVVVYTHTYTTRYRRDIRKERFLQIFDDYYEIVETEDPEGRREYIVLKLRLTGPTDQASSGA